MASSEIYKKLDEVETGSAGTCACARQRIEELGLSGKVKIIGNRTHLEIWDPRHVAAALARKRGAGMPSAAASFATEMAMAHVPVLTQELLDLLDVRTDSRVVDCTFGAGGHAESRGGAAWARRACWWPVTRTPSPRTTTWTSEPRSRCRSRFYLGNFADTLADAA